MKSIKINSNYLVKQIRERERERERERKREREREEREREREREERKREREKKKRKENNKYKLKNIEKLLNEVPTGKLFGVLCAFRIFILNKQAIDYFTTPHKGKNKEMK